MSVMWPGSCGNCARTSDQRAVHGSLWCDRVGHAVYPSDWCSRHEAHAVVAPVPSQLNDKRVQIGPLDV